MWKTNAIKKAIPWIPVIVALILLLTAYVQYQGKVDETQLRIRADERAMTSEQNAKREREALETLERQQDSIRKFMVNYRAHLLSLKNGFLQLKHAKAYPQDFSPEKIRKLEDDLIRETMAFTKFLNEWRDVQKALSPFLNGDADALTAAAMARNVTEMEKRSELLERNIEDKERVLEEAVKTLQ